MLLLYYLSRVKVNTPRSKKENFRILAKEYNIYYIYINIFFFILLLYSSFEFSFLTRLHTSTRTHSAQCVTTWKHKTRTCYTTRNIVTVTHVKNRSYGKTSVNSAPAELISTSTPCSVATQWHIKLPLSNTFSNYNYALNEGRT